jgi:hypothetical protein
MSITVLPIRSRRERRIFLTFPWHIFKDDPLWVPPLLPDLQERIDPRRGVFFQRGGEAECFIAWRDGAPVGTICAALDHESNAATGRLDCVFGFFHFIQDFEVMHSLLEQVKRWARQRGLTTITGPFNLDYEDSYGILVEGRDRPPALMCGHSPPYYYDFIERCGFEAARGDNLAFALDLTSPNPALDDLQRMAERVRQRGRFTVRSGRLDRWEDELEHIYVLLNKALAHLNDHRPWPREVVSTAWRPFARSPTRSDPVRRTRRADRWLAAGTAQPERGLYPCQRPALPLGLPPAALAYAQEDRLPDLQERADPAGVLGQRIGSADVRRDHPAGPRPRLPLD